MKSNHERRAMLQGVELRAEENAEGRSLSGYAAVFNALSVDLGGFREKIAPGAFKASLGSDVMALWSHNMDLVLGRTLNGSLKLEEDERGLRFRLNLPDTSLGRDTFVTVNRGDVTGVSFAFDTVRDSWERVVEGEPPTRTLHEVRLFEISPTAWPAYPQTDVAARSLAAFRETLKPWAPSADQLRRRLSLAEVEG